MGGLDAASIPGWFTQSQLDVALGAEVFIEVAGKVEFHGTVDAVSPARLIANSLSKSLEDRTRGRIYKVPMVEPWLDDLTGSVNGGSFTTVDRDGKIRITQKPGSTVSAPGAPNNHNLKVSTWVADQIKRFDYDVVNNKSTLFNAAVLKTSGKLTGYTTLAAHTGASATGQTVSPNAQGLSLQIVAKGTASPSNDDHWIEFTNMRFYGVTLASTPNLYDSEVIADIVGGLADSVSTSFIESDTEDVYPLEFPIGTNLMTQAMHVANRTGKQFGGWPRLQGGMYEALPVYREFDETPAYFVDATSDDVTEGLSGVTTTDVATRAISTYKDNDGIELYTTTELDDETNPIDRANINKDVVVSLGEGSSAQASALGAKVLALSSEERNGGTMTIRGAVLDYQSGARILLSDIEAGKIIAASTTRYGLITGRIQRADFYGGTMATVQIDSGYDEAAAVKRIANR